MKEFIIPAGPQKGRKIKFGRKRPRVVHPHLKLRNYLRMALPSPPTSCDFTPAAMPVLSDIYGNDSLGDCVIAGGYHVVGVETGNSGTLFHASSAQIVSDYSAIGGYVPGDPSTDNGCDLQTALAYWTSNGFANGTKLYGYLAVDATNWTEVMTACWLFENLYLGLELPDSYVNPFPSASGFTWDDDSPDPNNGHCIMSPAKYASGGLGIDTWGMIGTFTQAALAHLCSPGAGGELWVMLTPDQLMKGASKAPNGVDWVSILQDFNSMGGNVPVPSPTPPSPPGPAPTTAPTRDQVLAAIDAAFTGGHALLTRGQAKTQAEAAVAPLWP